MAQVATEVEEVLYNVMEDFVLHVPIGKGRSARVTTIDIEPITIIGATTIAGGLSEPMRNRFLIHETIDYYSTDDLRMIALASSKKLNITIDDDSAREIAKRSRGIPRILNGHLRWCRDLAQSRKIYHLSLDLCLEAFQMQGVDKHGLNKLDREYMGIKA